ncbi:GNAT family N-acetyltransferase [Chromobacterium sp. IIBBL 290-4]|uniref:GNAT family N-acetyltransferase n=1 Tax=Chromobacterium sp. IIBBL 290-4 TaxID=2953890 RepID=UPI0020B8257B|nr:GNAT family N-acetyltransferase [Chromobacterium sp. IIBBL 290-4]UTH72466.1 GNAT family N-acetyltransferase [Chromobacterium sp. IIBBL 290-4]
MNDYLIRHAEPGDAAALRELMADPLSYGNTLQLPYPSLRHWEKEAQRQPSDDSCQLVCETRAGELLGSAGLWRFEGARKRHGAALAITVQRGYRGQGVGTALMAALLDTADNWMGLLRIELWVYPDNAAAIALYRKFGFEMEGRLRGYALRDGAYHDALAMARLKEGLA